MDCRICGDTIPPARLSQWPWAKTCSTEHSLRHEGESQKRHRKAYRKRRDAKARAGRAALLRRETDQQAGEPE